MSRMICGTLVGLVVSIVGGTGCSHRSASASSVEAPAPSMPAHWKVISDFNAAAGQIKPIAEQLGGDIAALRNTVYDVNGERVQLNVIVATDGANADKIMASVRKMKSDIALLRVGLTIYKFVGPNGVLPAIREGKAHLQKTLGES